MVQWYQGMTLDQIEKQVIKKSLALNGGNKTQTAIALGIAIRTLQNKLAEIDAEAVANEEAQVARLEESRKELERARGPRYDQDGRAILPRAE